MSKVMVTGANGYLGRGIVTELLDCGNDVIATDVKIDGIDKRATKIACDLFNVENPYHYFVAFGMERWICALFGDTFIRFT